jgi:hypothetical protein
MQRDQKSRYDKKEEYVTSSSENEVHLSLVVTEIQAMLARSVKVKPRRGIKNRLQELLKIGERILRKFPCRVGGLQSPVHHDLNVGAEILERSIACLRNVQLDRS